MPLKKTGKEQDHKTSVNEEAVDGDPDDEDCDDDDEDWINDIGLHSNLRSKLWDKWFIKIFNCLNLYLLFREAERLQDGGQGTSQGTYSDSLLLIEGGETQGLFNWLLNSKLCLSTTGPLAGIPPTLFSPVAFHQATLRPLKVSSFFLLLPLKRKIIFLRN